MIGAAPQRDHAPEQLEVRAGHRAVALDRRDLERLDARVRERRSRRPRRDAGAAGHPAVAHRQPLADVEGDGDPIRPVAIHEPARERRILQGRRPDDDAGRAGRRASPPRCRRRAARPRPRPGPTPPPRRRSPGPVRLAGARITGAVEVDHVEPPCARPRRTALRPRPDRRRVDRRLAEVAAQRGGRRGRRGRSIAGRSSNERLGSWACACHAAMITL